MQRIRLGICIGDNEYKTRFINCLMNHYRNQLELHIFSEADQIDNTNDILVLADCMEWLDRQLEEGNLLGKCLYLLEPEKEGEREEERVVFVDKYLEVNRIVEEILKHVGTEIREVQKNGYIPVKTRIVAVYALAENEYQLPFAITLGSIFSEKEQVLLLDLQENSGITQICKQQAEMGLEELLVMAESGKYSKARMNLCIGRMDHMDFSYPTMKGEYLYEVGASTYRKLLQMITQEQDYSVIILNLGSRFQGFFEVLSQCHEIYMMQKHGGLCKWREYEFFEEAKYRGYEMVCDRITRIELPALTASEISFERIVEQWKWNEFGDYIRRLTPGEVKVGIR